jgi:hypothetical protein
MVYYLARTPKSPPVFAGLSGKWRLVVEDFLSLSAARELAHSGYL